MSTMITSTTSAAGVPGEQRPMRGLDAPRALAREQNVAADSASEGRVSHDCSLQETNSMTGSGPPHDPPQDGDPRDVEAGWVVDSDSVSLEDVRDTDGYADAVETIAPVIGPLQRAAQVYQRIPYGKIIPDDYFLDAFFAVNFVQVRQNTRAAKTEYMADGGLNNDWLGTGGKWATWNDGFESALRGHITRHYERLESDPNKPGKPLVFNNNQFAIALQAVCHRNQVDPFLEWIESLPPWDGVPRCATVLVDHFNGLDQESDLIPWASRYFFVGALQRSYEPGCKIDETPVLISGQGTGKSSFIRSLLRNPDWFGDSLDLSAPTKMQSEALAGRVIVEMSEMVGSNRLDIERMKAFLSRTNDGQHRAAYARSPEDHPRMCIFIGTANDAGGGILPNDPTGNRRFVVIPFDSAKGPVEEMVEEIRDQLWAEARDRRANGEPEFLNARLPRELMSVAAKVNDEYRRSDTTLEDGIAGLNGSEERTLAELADMLNLHDKQGPLDRQVQDRLARALRAKGWEKRQTKKGGPKRWVWWDPAVSDSTAAQPKGR